jgi:hypothetical protein
MIKSYGREIATLKCPKSREKRQKLPNRHPFWQGTRRGRSRTTG